MDAEGSKKFKQFQGYLKGKKWKLLRQFLERTPIGISQSSSAISSAQVSAGIAHAMEFARSLIDAMIEMIDAGAGSTQSIHEVRHYCEKLYDNGAISVSTRVLELFNADPRIAGRVATLLRLLCQAETVRDGIGEEGIVCTLVKAWMYHKDCIPLIEALVTLTSSHMDNISHALTLRAMTIATEIINANPLAITSHSSKKTVVSSAEKLIDLTTRVVAMCAIHSADTFAGESRKQRSKRNKEMGILIPKLFQVLQTAVALGTRNIIINLMSALANISDCHIKNGYGRSLGGNVNAGDVVNLVLQGWTLFKEDEHVMTVAVWALTAYTTVCPQAFDALKSNHCSALHNLAKPWKGFVTVDFLCEKVGPGTYAKFTRSSRKTRNSQKAAAIVDDHLEKSAPPSSHIINQKYLATEEDDITHPVTLVSPPPKKNTRSSEHVELCGDASHLISSRRNRSSQKQSFPDEEETVPVIEKDEDFDEGATKKRFTRSSASAALFEDEEKGEVSDVGEQEEGRTLCGWVNATVNSSQETDVVADDDDDEGDDELDLETKPTPKAKYGKRVTRLAASAGGRMQGAVKTRLRGSSKKNRKAAAASLAATPIPVIIISDEESEQDDKSETVSEDGSDDVRNVHNKRRGQATPNVRCKLLVSGDSDDDFEYDGLKDSVSSEGMDEASRKRRSARLQTRTKTSFEPHLGMLGRSANPPLKQKQVTQSAPRPSRRRVYKNTRAVEISESGKHCGEKYTQVGRKVVPIELEDESPKPAVRSRRQQDPKTAQRNYPLRQRGVASTNKKKRVVEPQDIHELIGEDEDTRTSFDGFADDEHEHTVPEIRKFARRECVKRKLDYRDAADVGLARPAKQQRM